jgi:hypothetical protein
MDLQLMTYRYQVFNPSPPSEVQDGCCRLRGSRTDWDRLTGPSDSRRIQPTQTTNRLYRP